MEQVRGREEESVEIANMAMAEKGEDIGCRRKRG